MVRWSENAARLPGGLFPQSFFGLTFPTPGVGQTGQVRPPELPGFALGVGPAVSLAGGLLLCFPAGFDLAAPSEYCHTVRMCFPALTDFAHAGGCLPAWASFLPSFPAYDGRHTRRRSYLVSPLAFIVRGAFSVPGVGAA